MVDHKCFRSNHSTLADGKVTVYGVDPKGLKTGLQTHSGTCSLIAALFPIAERWVLPKCPSTEEWKNRMWYLHIMEYYLDLKKLNPDRSYNRYKPWTHAQGKMPDTQGDKLYNLIFIWNFQNRQIHRNRKENGGCQELKGGGNGECLLTSTEFPFWVMEMFGTRKRVSGCTTLWIW